MLQLYKASSKVSRRTTFWNREYFPSFLIETLLALIHPNIFCKDIYFTTNKSYYLEEIKYEVNDFLTLVVLARIYVIFRFMISISQFYSPRSSRIAQLIGTKLTRTFAVRCIVKVYPFLFLICFSSLSIVMLSFMLKIIEGPVYSPDKGINDFRSIPNCLWNILVTMTTVGYGDMYPITNLGRIINILASIGGTFFVALLTLSLQNSLTFTSFEEKAYSFRKKLLMEDQLKIHAGRLFKASFLYSLARKKYRVEIQEDDNEKKNKKNRKIMEEELYHKIEHKRRFKKSVQFYRNNYETLTEADVLDTKMDEFREGLNEMTVNNKKLEQVINKSNDLLQNCLKRIGVKEKKLQ